jgi:V8-like Glu-specific endopeptidase
MNQQNAQDLLIRSIEELLMEGEVKPALDALLDLDAKSQAGIRNDLILISGNYNRALKAFKVEMTMDERDFARTSAQVRAGLLEVMKSVPRRLALNAQLRSLDTYQFNVPDAPRLEKILGPQDNLLKINWLKQALSAARAVCRVVCSDGELGTGFLIEGGYLITNNHVILDAKMAADTRIEFNYELDANGQIKSRSTYRLNADSFVSSPDAELDFVRVKVIDDTSQPLAQWGHLRFASGSIPVVGEPATIIQHPKGQDKQIALNANEVISVWKQYLFYNTDTEPGSSGAPVFNRNWEVMAVHHAGLSEAEGGLVINEKGEKRGANRGILAGEIVRKLGGAG